MAKIVMIGGGMVGLTTSLTLARRGHEVTVLERNDAPPPERLEDAWEKWERPGCAQFRHGHAMLPPFTRTLRQELPEMLDALVEAGALDINATMMLPPEAKREDDDQFRMVTGRRPIFEWVFAQAVESEPNIRVERGVAVTELVAGEGPADLPHVVGVRTDDGRELRADLVIDAGGRRSALAAHLEALGARPFHEESEEFSTRYYGRYFRSTDGQFPDPFLRGFGPHAAEGFGALLLPADNTTWMIGIVGAASDANVRPLAEPDRWNKAIATFELLEPWLDGEPISEIQTMVGIPDRYRRFVVDGSPVATGIAAIGDAWAATNPSLGRGISMGVMQAMIVVDEFERFADDPMGLALSIDERVEAEVTPFYRQTIAIDKENLAALEAAQRGEAAPPRNPLLGRLDRAAAIDPDMLRAMLKLRQMLELPDRVLTPDLLARLDGMELPEIEPARTPSYEEIVAIAQA